MTIIGYLEKQNKNNKIPFSSITQKRGSKWGKLNQNIGLCLVKAGFCKDF